jgi:hypothetical protein
MSSMFCSEVLIKILEQRWLLLMVTYTAWDTLNVTDMNAMFLINTAFNNWFTINSNWNTSKVTNMSRYVSGSNFNQDIGTKVVTVGYYLYSMEYIKCDKY